MKLDEVMLAIGDFILRVWRGFKLRLMRKARP